MMTPPKAFLSFDFRHFDFFNIPSSTKADLSSFSQINSHRKDDRLLRKEYIPLGLYNSSCPLLICCRTNRRGGGNTRGRMRGEGGEINIATPRGTRYVRPRQLKCIPYLILYQKLFRKFRNLFVHTPLPS